MSYNPNNPPYVALSTPHAWYCDGTDAPAEDSGAWKPVVVVVAELTPKTNSLVVCPVMDCHLAPYPIQPMVQALIPEDHAVLTSCNLENQVVSFRVTKKDCASHFCLRFSDILEFWDCVRLIANVLCDAEGHRGNLGYRMAQVLNSIPCHKPGDACMALCTNPAHIQCDQGTQTDD